MEARSATASLTRARSVDTHLFLACLFAAAAITTLFVRNVGFCVTSAFRATRLEIRRRVIAVFVRVAPPLIVAECPAQCRTITCWRGSETCDDSVKIRPIGLASSNLLLFFYFSRALSLVAGAFSSDAVAHPLVSDDTRTEQELRAPWKRVCALEIFFLFPLRFM